MRLILICYSNANFLVDLEYSFKEDWHSPDLLWTRSLRCVGCDQWAVDHRKGKINCSSIYMISLAATIYFLRGQRNLRNFQNKNRDVNGLAAAIFDSIQTKPNLVH